MEAHSELEYLRRHLIEQKTPAERAMVMAGIDRILDQMLDMGDTIEIALPNSAEGQAHIERGSQ